MVDQWAAAQTFELAMPGGDFEPYTSERLSRAQDRASAAQR